MENNITININFNNVKSDDNILLIQYLYDCLSNYTYIEIEDNIKENGTCHLMFSI